MGQPEPEPDPLDPQLPPEPPEPPEPDPADAVPVPRDSTASATVGIDAALSVKAEAFAPTLNVRVRTPGEAETAPGTPRGDRTAIRGQHNWLSIGPRNVGGRIRAIAVEPGSTTMYAAPASGGVFKSVDGGDSWFPLWHDEPSLSMAALAIGPQVHPGGGAVQPGDPAVVWAATGEPQAGGGETIPAAGVWRSEDGGQTWRGPNVGQTILTARIHSLAAHPTRPLTCWAAAGQPGDATAGLYRTTDGGQTWTQFCAQRGFGDVKFATIGGSLRLFAVPQGTTVIGGPVATNTRGLIVRLDRPDDPVPAPAAALVAGVGPFLPGADPLLAIGSPVPALAAGATAPDLGKLAIYPGGAPGFANPVLYVAYTHEDRGDTLTADRSFSAIFRSNNPQVAAPTGLTFSLVPPAPTFGAEGQGGYNIALAVSPLNPNHLAFGMVELYLHRNANGTGLPAPAHAPVAGDWLRAQMIDLHHIERGHHADHHDLLFAPAPNAPFDNGVAANGLVLWDANDGGLSWCPDWAAPTTVTYPMGGPELDDAVFPPTPNACTWRKRSHGISATQMYDLTQHPRLPSVMGAGFQDNGVYLGLSGPSWQLALTADGGFVAFDPDDPYRMVVTYQGGVTEARFPGRLRDALPLPRDDVQLSLWPRELQDGFHPGDPPLFTAETAWHPRRPGRLLHARRNRLYGTRPTTGDRWIPEPLGTAFEIFYAPTQSRATRSAIEVLDTPGGRSIGLVPQLAVTRRNDTENAPDDLAESRIRAVMSEPYAIRAGTDVRLSFSNDALAAPIPLTIPLTVGADLPASASAAQVAAYLATRLAAGAAGTTAATVVLPVPRELVIASTQSGVAQQVVIGGSAAVTLGAVARTYRGANAGAGPGAPSAALPAIAALQCFVEPAGTDFAGQVLDVSRGTAATLVHIDFDLELPPPASSHVTVGQLTALLKSRLVPTGNFEVWDTSAIRALRLTSTAPGAAATTITATGNLLAAHGGQTTADVVLLPAAANRSRRLGFANQFVDDQIDLSPIPPPAPPAAPTTPRTLRLREGGHPTALQQLTAAFLNVTDLTQVSVVELCQAVRAMLAAAPAVRIRCDLEFSSTRDNEQLATGEVTELAFGPPGSTSAYVGDRAGRFYRSTDDGEHWVHPPSLLDGRFGECDAIAVQPDRPDVVLVGLYAEGFHDPAVPMLFKSVDGGTTFTAAPAQIDNGRSAPDRRVLGVRALVFDPGAPGHVYAATDLGVHHSPDAGATWTAFNAGLPNCYVTDLALATQTRVLRAGVWGRGVYERRLDPADVRDVRLHIRSTALDDGTAQPTPGPDLMATLPESFRFDTSPDIKPFRHDPRIGAILDGAEFDDDLRAEDAAVGPAFVAVQVHNRGAFPTSGVRVTAFWAIADDGPPPVPPALWAALAAPPIAPNTVFDDWTAIGDEAVTGPAGPPHETVAPGYPRVVVLGASAAFSWPASIDTRRRIGILALVRSGDDPLPAAPTRPVEVLDLIRREAKIAYRECAVVPQIEDNQVMLRTRDGSPMAIVAVAGGENAANGAAPFGLAAVALPGVPDVRFQTAGPYALPAAPVRRRFQVQIRTSATATFPAPDPVTLVPGDPDLPDLTRVFARNAVNVINKALVGAGVPVQARRAGFTANADDAVILTGLSRTRYTVAGNAAATLGLTAGAPVATNSTPHASRGPWNFTPAAPRTLTITATTTVEITVVRGRDGIPAAGPVSAATIRSAINRQLALGGLSNIVCEPVRRRLAVRRSATEAADARHGIGSAVLADLVAAPAAVSLADRATLFDVVRTHGPDTVAAAGNHLYLRSANLGNVAEAAVRHRLFLVDDAIAAPITLTVIGAPTLRPLPVGGSAIVEFAAVAVPGTAAGDHRFVLAIADIDAAGLRLGPAGADLASLDALLVFCARHTGAAVREFVAR